MFIKENSAWINIELACEYLDLSRSAYYSWLLNYEKHLEAAKSHVELSKKVIELFEQFKKRYGSRKLSEELLKLGILCPRKKVAKIMEANNLVPCGYKKFKVTTTNSNHKYKV